MTEEKTPKTRIFELSPTRPPMELEQDHYGMWVYYRPPWMGGPEIRRNGVLPIQTVERADAEAYVNKLYPGSFPEPEVEPPVTEAQ
jgi:hypothetical protein